MTSWFGKDTKKKRSYKNHERTILLGNGIRGSLLLDPRLCRAGRGGSILIQKMKYFSSGEIFRLKLLRNNEGKPYSDKSTISRIVRTMKHKVIQTPWGPSKQLSEDQIRDYNRKWK